jgi:hypothetical protein
LFYSPKGLKIAGTALNPILKLLQISLRDASREENVSQRINQRTLSKVRELQLEHHMMWIHLK